MERFGEGKVPSFKKVFGAIGWGRGDKIRGQTGWKEMS